MKLTRLRHLTALLLILTALITAAVAAAADSPAEARVLLPILMYHEVKHQKLGKDAISPYELESDLRWLRQHGFTTVTVGDVIDYVNHNAILPENPVILSFDDGYLSTYKYVLPLLKKYNAKIVLSVIVKNTDDFSRIPDDNLDYSHVTWRQLNAMLDSGLVEVQNHTYCLHSTAKGRYGCLPKQNEPPDRYEALLISDLLKAQNKIYMMTGCLPRAFSYPYGSTCVETDTILKKLGFEATLSCRYGVNFISRGDTDCLFRLRRVCRAHGDNLSALLTEAYKTVKRTLPPAIITTSEPPHSERGSPGECA